MLARLRRQSVVGPTCIVRTEVPCWCPRIKIQAGLWTKTYFLIVFSFRGENQPSEDSGIGCGGHDLSGASGLLVCRVLNKGVKVFAQDNL